MNAGRLVIFTLFLALSLNVAFWFYSRDLQAQWLGVPPVPTENGAIALALGDPQFAYRSLGTILQNIGDTGGNVTPLHEYDYDKLGQWFWVMDDLDSVSNYVPLLAAYYFGASQDVEDLRVVIEYLAEIGARPGTQKWRWLGQAVFLARFRLEDLELSLELAYKLAAMQSVDDMPTWTRQMPAFVLRAMGEKEAARAIMQAILETDKSLQRNEVNFMKHYIEERLGEDEE